MRTLNEQALIEFDKGLNLIPNQNHSIILRNKARTLRFLNLNKEAIKLFKNH